MKNYQKMIIVGFLAVVLIAAIMIFGNSFQEDPGEGLGGEVAADDSLEIASMDDERLTGYNDNIQSGGPPPDGIPPVQEPQYHSMAEADFLMDDQDVVFIVEAENMVYIYPQRILVWHEIVNEDFDGEKVSITYCPLTGSAIGYKGSFAGIETDFGTSGKLINSNLVMYDRETDSYIPQILGIAVEGDLKGQRLEEFPVLWSTWGNVKDTFEEMRVLSESTGFIRDYNRDPYGSYVEGSGYYYNNTLVFPVMYQDEQFERKEVMIAGRVKEHPFAIPKAVLAEEKNVSFTVEEYSLIANYDEDLDTARIFIDDGEETFVNSYDVMWFAWYAFFPETMVYE